MRKLVPTIVLLAALAVPRMSQANDWIFGDLLNLISNNFGGDLVVEKLWTYSSGVGEGGAEIVAYDDVSKLLFVTNAATDRIDVLDVVDGTKVGELDPLGSPNSVAAYDGIVAVAAEGATVQSIGHVAFFNATTLTLIRTIPAGALPDMLTFTADGRYVLVANEGEPDDDYLVDPEGSVTIIDLKRGVNNATARTASFVPFNSSKQQLIDAGVRIFGPGNDVDGLATVAQDLEPEYITTEGNTAYVVCQEANAIATINIRTARVERIDALGFKDHSLPGNALDASNSDGAINIANWPVYGAYMPDAIASFRYFGWPFIVTANEGDARDYDGYSEVERIRDLDLDPDAFPDAATLQANANLGRLNATTTLGDLDGDGDYDELYCYGGRSFSIWTPDWSGKLNLVYDSGEEFEQITADRLPLFFNSSNSSADFDSRSDDKGPEPEAVAIGTVFGGRYAFIGLERIGGIMIYDLTHPTQPEFVDYINDRFDAPGGDAGPECVLFVPFLKSPLVTPIIAVANEISGTTSVYRVRRDFTLPPWMADLLDSVIPDLF